MNKCNACGKETDQLYAVCSMFGAFTIGVCEECLNSGRDSYSLMVSDIACCGRFPDDINEAYREEVRQQLKLHGKTEEQFIRDIDAMNKDIFDAMRSVLETAKYD